jgi:hypothetical protein
LADLGLCLEVENDVERLTDTFEAVGSRLYIAPENESGINEDVDQRPADFYAYGKLVWQMLTGRQALARELQREPGNRLADVLQDRRYEALDLILDRLLNRDPRARLVNWVVVLAELFAIEQILEGKPVEPRVEVLQRLREAARRIPSTPRIREVHSRESSVRELGERLSAINAALSSRVGDIQKELWELQAASEETLRLGVGGGGPSLVDLVQQQPRFALPDFSPDAPANPWGGFALLFQAHCQGVTSVPRLYLGVHVSLQPMGVWLLRIPCFHHWDGTIATPHWSIDRYYEASGPLAIDRAHPLKVAADFGAETGSLFMEFAAHYVTAIPEGLDPIEASD